MTGSPEAAAALSAGAAGVDDDAVMQGEELDGGVGDQSFEVLITDVDNCIEENVNGQKERKVVFYPNGIPDHVLTEQPRVLRPELGSGLSVNHSRS